MEQRDMPLLLDIENLKLKDTGYAWVVLVSMFASNLLMSGYARSFGIIFNAITDAYPDTAVAMGGLMFGLFSGCRALLAPVASALTNVIGIRKTLLLGTCIQVAGFAASFFCTSVLQLSFTLGVMIGSGSCLVESCQVIIISLYFESKLPLANGFRVAGGPCGSIVYPIIVIYLLENFGLRLMYIMLALVSMQLFILSFLVRPIHVHTKIQTLDFMKRIRATDNNCEEIHVSHFNAGFNSLTLKPNKMQVYDPTLFELQHNSCRKGKQILDFSLLTSPAFLLFILIAAISPMGFSVGFYYAIIYGKQSLGLSHYEISIVLLSQGVSDIIIRLCLGWINNKILNTKEEYGMMISFWCCALGCILLPRTTGVKSLMCAMVLHSFGTSSFYASSSVILCNHFGQDSIASSWAFVSFTLGIFEFVYSLFIGLILDHTVTFDVPFLVLGVSMVLCSFIIPLESTVVKSTKTQT